MVPKYSDFYLNIPGPKQCENQTKKQRHGRKENSFPKFYELIVSPQGPKLGNSFYLISPALLNRNSHTIKTNCGLVILLETNHIW